MSESNPILLAVDDDSEALARIEDELERRYGGDYRIVCESSADAASRTLERLRASGDEVAIVLADQWMPDSTGSELLAAVRRTYPRAKRALLIEWGGWADRPTADAILQAMALGRIDYYALKPRRHRDEQFHRLLTELLHEWTRQHTSAANEIAVISDPDSRRGHEIRQMLARSGVPHGCHNPNSDAARELIGGTDAGGEYHDPERLTALCDRDGAIVRLHDGRVYVNPSNEELAAGIGVDTELPSERDFDVVIIGGGPAGLSAAVYASSEGLRTLVIERESIGGQAGSSSLIRNYLGFARGVSGGELAQRAYQQAWVFGTRFAITREVTGIEPGPERHTIEIGGSETVTAPAVLLATGVAYRRLGLPALEELGGVYYGASTADAQGLAGEDVYVVGGGNSAGQLALHLSRAARRVTLLIRGPSLAADMSHYLMRTIDAAPNVGVRLSTEVAGGGGDGTLEWLELREKSTGRTEQVPAAAVFIMIGARPHTSWLPAEVGRDEAGYVLTGSDVWAGENRSGWPLERMPTMFETSVPGIFAIGDVRHGALKRVAASVGEGSVVIRQIHAWLDQRRMHDAEHSHRATAS